MTTNSTPTAPPDAAKLAPKGAEGLTYAIHLVGRDDVQSWSEPSAEWLDGANGAYEGDPTVMVWWRTKPETWVPALDDEVVAAAAKALAYIDYGDEPWETIGSNSRTMYTESARFALEAAAGAALRSEGNPQDGPR